MKISFLSGLNPIKPKMGYNPSGVTFRGLQKDTFVKSAAPVEEPKQEPKFDVDSAINELRQCKSHKGEPKFTDEKLEEIRAILKENPEKWPAIQKLASQPLMVASLVVKFASRDVEKLNAITELSLMKKEDGKPRFSPIEIRRLEEQLDVEELKAFSKLADTPLDSDVIMGIAKNKDIKDIDKLREKVMKMVEEAGGDFRRISFERDKYDKNAYNIRIDLPNNGSRILVLDENLNETALDIVRIETSETGHTLQIKDSIDYRNNTESHVTAEISRNLPTPIVVKEERVVKDKQGNVVRTEIMELSDVPGTPNIKYVYPDGTEKVISSAKVDPETGVTTVQKDMESLDGTRTQYSFVEDKNGNMTSGYKITDKDGNVIFEHNMTFTVISDNKFISTENDKSYEITVNNDRISVKNMQTGEVTDIVYDGFMDGNREKLMASLKRMPAEELIALGKNAQHLTGIENTHKSTFATTTKTISSGDNLFTVLHEIGHAKDYADVDVYQKETLIRSIFSNPEVNKIFEEERAAFNAAFPLAQRDHISYFIELSDHQDGLQEIIAETNALINTKNTEDLFSIRSHYLQQYFPKTIAMIASIID